MPIKVIDGVDGIPANERWCWEVYIQFSKAMQGIGIDTHVVSGEEGNGDYKGLSPYNKNNSDLLLKIVNELQPDIVHIQMEHGLYGLNFRSLVPGKITTSLDSFYSKCPKPIVTTFHSAYDFKEWVNLDPNFQRTGYLEKIKWKIRKLRNYWFRSINYEPFNNLNEQILNHSKAGIVFSHYLCNFIPGCKVIYHGSEPAFPEKITKQFARKIAFAREWQNSTFFRFLPSLRDGILLIK
jgi:glycosyltransferase involved in cell wall biosynthesis